MGECLIVRRGGESYELPVLSASYPKDVTVTAAPGASASFSVRITTPGRPAEYTYQWYKNGAAISGATGASLTLTGLTAAATYSVYCKVTNKAGSVASRTATLTVRSYLPAYTYTGSHQLLDDGNFNWRLKLLTSGTLTFSHLGSAAGKGAQAFLVGGGGGGWYGPSQGGGGGGGYTATSDVALAVGTEYSIVVGAGGNQANGGDTKAMGVTASGGKRGGPAGFCAGGSGGGYAGGNGGSDGGNGAGWHGDTSGGGGQGQGTTTREFGEASGALYAGGGGGGKADRNPPGGAPGGDGGGGHGGWGGAPTAPAPGTPNTGGGGGGNYSGDPGAGGSGIVIIRNKR